MKNKEKFIKKVMTKLASSDKKILKIFLEAGVDVNYYTNLIGVENENVLLALIYARTQRMLLHLSLEMENIIDDIEELRNKIEN